MYFIVIDCNSLLNGLKMAAVALIPNSITWLSHISVTLSLEWKTIKSSKDDL